MQNIDRFSWEVDAGNLAVFDNLNQGVDYSTSSCQVRSHDFDVNKI
jgi:hypothetical protein